MAMKITGSALTVGLVETHGYFLGLTYLKVMVMSRKVGGGVILVQQRVETLYESICWSTIAEGIDRVMTGYY